MPCKDVTERMELTLDADDRLASYRFAKRSCGQGIGVADLLLPCLRGLELERILAYSAESFLAEFPARAKSSEDEELMEFLQLKHLFAIQSVLEVLTGKESGRKDDLCAAASIDYGANGLVIRAQIAVDVVTDKIKACGRCQQCAQGTARRKKPRRSAVPSAN